MPKVITFPRLTRRDCERLLDVHQQLNRCRDVLDAANWAGGKACSTLIMSALILVSELYNRAEVAFLSGGEPRPAPSPENGQPEVTAEPGQVIEVDPTTVVHREE